jgi:hypothetical protein
MPEDDGNDSASVEEFLSDTANFERTEDKMGTETVDVQVGVEGNGRIFRVRIANRSSSPPGPL